MEQQFNSPFKKENVSTTQNTTGNSSTLTNFYKESNSMSQISVQVNIKNTSKHENPSYATVGSAGMDIRANIESPITLKPNKRIAVPTGIHIELPLGFEAQIRPRSGLAFKHGIDIINSPGTIDSDYKGEIKILLVNHGEEDFIINDGDRIAQMVVAKHEIISFINVNELGESERGSGGFGHSGVK